MHRTTSLSGIAISLILGACGAPSELGVEGDEAAQPDEGVEPVEAAGTAEAAEAEGEEDAEGPAVVGAPDGHDDDAADAEAPGERVFLAGVTPRVRIQAVKRSELATRPPAVRSAVGALFTARTGDFDRDGKLDRFSISGKTFTIAFGSGKRLDVPVPDADWTFSAVEPIGLGPANRISFVLSVHSYDSWFNRAPQVLVYDAGGTYQTRVLTNVNIIGRDVHCTKVPAKWTHAVCMFASYARDGRAYSALVEIAPDGTARAVTQSKGLPWSAGGVRLDGKYANGKYMMGFAFVDLNRDRLPDLVGAGQHSAIGYALMRPRASDGYDFGATRWFDDQDEYMDISSLGKVHSDFPCVYAHIESLENGRSPRGDFLTCFDKASSTWRAQPMPRKTRDGEAIAQFVRNAGEARMVDVGPAVYLATKAKMGNGQVEDVFLEITPSDGTPEIVEPVLRSEVFDAAYYLSTYADLRKAFGATAYDRATAHWLKSGIGEGRRGSAEFSSKIYLARYADLRASFGNDYRRAIQHYIRSGIAAGRDGN